MMFSDASEILWGSCITQVPTVELEGSVAFADMSHELLGVRRSDGQLWTRWASRP